ncbi:Pro-Pol polyprotein [Folsomia candida]|uniref:Pro-Pol polyprotein n=1 Tax=Folsomia candida TaxID=158441 RepID=A0A226DDM6_FOLCA|nr:Pro-Pol polyprotein [Folsomia candida]
MDRLTRRRAPLRATITKTVNDIDEELEKDPPDQEVLNLKLNKLGRLLTEVGDLDQKIHATRFKVEKVLRPGGKTPSPPASFYSVESEGHQKKTFKLPKIQLKKFSGDLKEWLGWWSQFSKIDEDEELHASDKFQYLLQCMVTGSRARGLVESFPMTAENYPKAIIALKERFGKEKLLQQVYVRELLRLVIATAKSKEKIVLSELYDKVETQLRALESLGIKPEHTTLFLFPMVESCLPEETLTTWHHSPLRKEDGSKLVPPKNELHFLMEFLREEVENEATMRLVRAGFETTAIHESSGKEKKKNGSKAEVAKSKNNEDSIPTAAGLFAGQKSYTCIFCSKSHPSPDCFKAQNMNLQDKNELIEVKKACSICLGTGHRSNSCRTPVKCILCSRKHQTVMCPEIWSLRKTGHKTPEAESPTTMNGMAMNSHACSGDVLLQTLMVRLYNEGGGYKVARLVFRVRIGDWWRPHPSRNDDSPGIEMEQVPRRPDVQQIFDPMGFLSPATLVPKMLLQKTWETKMKWDEELSVNLKKEFLAWWNQASDLEQIHIPRYAIRSTHDNLQLHTFCDASQNAYAAAVFIRVETEDEVFIQLLHAKSRVAPINKVTIPRLELLGCTIATRLTSAVKKALAFEDIPTFYWSDSTTALAWIRRNDEWGTFVGNRVKEICSLSRVEEWRHVPGKLNPADLPSRGCSPSELLDSRWWEGPGWLKSPDDEWPLQASEANEEQIMSEAKKKSIQMNAVDTLKSLWYVRYSSFTKNVRLVALIIRFANKLRKKSTEKGELKRWELESAEEKLFILVQQETFPTTRVPEDVIAGLRVFRDEDSTLLHVKTKLTHRNDDTNIFRQPVLLPNSHPLVDQLIREEHIYNAHAGAQFLMGRLRERCWIIQGRRAVRKIIKSCVICRRFTTKAPILQQAPLPEDRVKNARVFQTTGIDLAGPLYLKDGSKVWFVIFTCAVYRAIHLELVSASSTDAFLLALFRFISRRGRPSVIYSDNGTNFVGADNLFKKMDWKKIESATRVSRITWKFNPPSAAWWGGFWERLIRSVKDLLKRMLGHRKLDYEQLLTCLYEAEAVVNSRPLTLVTEDQDDLIPLTPAMFIQDIAEINCPEVENLTGMGLNRKYKQMKILHVELRNRFRKEYFGQLVQRGKHHRSVSFQVGDVVLIGDDNKKRIEWPMGRIIQLYPGKDGQVRVARVKTTTNEFLRALQRLFPLEVSSPTEVPSVPKVVMEKAVRKKKEKVKFEEKEVITRAGRRVKMPTRLGVDDTERH